MKRSWSRTTSHVDLAPTPSPPRPIQFTAEPQNLTLDLESTAVIVVDMQNDFCHTQGWLAGNGVDVSAGRDIITAINTLVRASREAGVPIIWLNWGNRQDLANLPPNVIHVYDPEGTGGGIGDPVSPLSDSVLVAGSGGAEIVEGLDVAPHDVHVDKYRMSGFWDTELDSILRQANVRHILFCGVNVDQCVFATLIDAACIGYDCVLISDACATTSPDYCTTATEYNVRQCFGFTSNSAAIAAAISERKGS